MGFEAVAVPGLPKAGQFSHVVKKGKFVFISGQTAPPEGGVAELDPLEQGRQIFEYLREAVTAAGGGMSDIVKLNIYLTGREQFPAISELRPQFFDPPYPATTTLVVHSMVRRELIMEVEAIAILD